MTDLFAVIKWVKRDRLQEPRQLGLPNTIAPDLRYHCISGVKRPNGALDSSSPTWPRTLSFDSCVACCGRLTSLRDETGASAMSRYESLALREPDQREPAIGRFESLVLEFDQGPRAIDEVEGAICGVVGGKRKQRSGQCCRKALEPELLPPLGGEQLFVTLPVTVGQPDIEH